MSKIVSTIAAVVMLTAAASAVAGPTQDYRSPDATAGRPAQNFASPDARPTAFRSTVAPADRRSPDARPSGRFAPSQPQSSPTSGSFDWAYLALGIAMVGLVLAIVLITQRRRRHELAIGH